MKKEKKRKFPQDVARFFHPEKSGSNALVDSRGALIKMGTHQYEKTKHTSYVPVKVMGPSMRRFNRNSI